MRACVRACVPACMCVCARVCMCRGGGGVVGGLKRDDMYSWPALLSLITN